MRGSTWLMAAVVLGSLAGVAAATPPGLSDQQAACFDGIAKGTAEAAAGKDGGWDRLVKACACAGTLRELASKAYTLCEVVAEVERDAAAAGAPGLPTCRGHDCFNRIGELKARTGGLGLE
jgi:hypothetical protein